MRKKLIYIAGINLDDDCSGITKKVISQYKIFSNNFDAYLFSYYGRDVKVLHGSHEKIIKCKFINRRYAILNLALSFARSNSIENFYIRRFWCNPFLINILKNLCKIGNVTILWEIPTYPYDYETLESFRFLQKVVFNVRLKLDKLFRKKLKYYLDRIVTFSNYNEIFNIPTINTGNGINVSSIRERTVLSNNKETFDLIAVAVLRHWHGYERLIRGIGNYYKTHGERNIVFHIVGDGPELQSYRELVKEFKIEDHVILYGFKNRLEIDEIYDKANMAVESLGWHRSKVDIGTSLKTREYLAKGLPILASSSMDIFPNGWEYAYYAPIDDSDINVEEVVKFYDSIISVVSEEELAFQIRKLAYEKCDMKNMMEPIIEYYMWRDGKVEQI